MSQQINLFNPIFLTQKKYFSTIAITQALGLLVLGCVMLSAYAHYQVANLETEATATTAQLTNSQQQLGRIKAEYAPPQKSQSLEKEIQATEVELRSLKQVFDTLQNGEFGSTAGYAEYLRAFARQSVDGVWLTGLSIVGAGNAIGVQGRALKPELVPAYMRRLKREPVMQGKSFGTFEMQTPPSVAAAVAAPGARAESAPQPAGYIEFSLH